MTDPVKLTFDDAQAQAMFARLSSARMLAPFMRDAGELLTETTQARFRTGTAPDGTPWKPLADGSGRTPLRKSGNMRDRITPHPADTFVEVIASARQAGWHQDGTDPYEIRAKPGKALAWPGMQLRENKDGYAGPAYVTKVNHPGLPARPFMGISSDDERQLLALGAAWLESLAADRAP